MNGLRGTLIAGAIALLLALLLLGQCQRARTAGAVARVSAAAGQAATASGQDAVASVGDVSMRDGGNAAITMENDNAIHSAEGAGVAVPAGVAAAARDGLCRRAAYRCTPDCLRRAAARGLAAASAGCAAAGR